MSDKKRVLFITYFFETKDGVGAQRVSYWANNIAQLSNDSISCDVLTSKYDLKEQHNGIDNVFCVGGEGKSIFNLFVKDQGYNWQKNIRSFFLKRDNSVKYDTIIISGGPFMQFQLVPFMKKLFNCQVILDFRDPFANNPHFGNSWLKIMVKAHYERLFINNADTVLTINETCSKLLSFSERNIDKLKIIENGYDDLIVDKANLQNNISDNDKINFVYAGKFYDDLNPARFLKLISSADNANNFSFSYIGTEASTIAGFESITDHGAKDYRSTIDIINSCDIGLIFTGGKPFESTTKIFDYIGLNKPIAIITGGTTKTGELHSITAGYPCVFWAENNETSILTMLEKLKSSNLEVNYPDRDTFSRRAGLIKLIDMI